MKKNVLTYFTVLDLFHNTSQEAEKNSLQEEERKKREKKTVNEESSFFVMPGNALKSLQDELKIAIDDSRVSRGVMERFGFRSGEGMAKNLKSSDNKINITSTCEMLPHLWAQSGFGSLMVDCIEDETITIKLKDSVEILTAGKQEKGTCNFTKGYIAGLISELLGKRYEGKELQCVSSGYDHCKLSFMPSLLSGETAPEDSLATEEKYDLLKGMSYLYVSTKGFDDIFDVFVDKITHGYEGICISRIFPKKIKVRYNMKSTRILWLTVEKGNKDTVWYPHLGKIHDIVVDFLKGSTNPIILLDGVEFLITKNNYKNTLSFLQVLIEKIAINDAIILIPVHPSTLQEQELSLIERETAVIKDINDIRRTRNARAREMSTMLKEKVGKPDEYP